MRAGLMSWISTEAYSLKSRACPMGLQLSDTSNNNSFYGTQVEFSTSNAILLTAGQATKNNFYGGLIQNCTGTGFNAAGDSSVIHGFYFENSGITTALLLSGTECAAYESYMSTAADAISVTGNGCR